MQPMAADLRVRLAAERSNAPVSVVKLIDRACQLVARAEGNEALSLQEITHACREAWEVATSADEVAETLRAWAARTDEGTAAVSGSEVRPLIAAAWGEIVAQRRAAQEGAQ